MLALNVNIKLVLELHSPIMVIALELSTSKPLPTLERITLSYVDSSLPDVYGVVFSSKRVIHDGPLALETGVDIYGLHDYLLNEGISTIISHHASIYLCVTVCITCYPLLYESI